jgi:hypothetical protein
MALAKQIAIVGNGPSRNLYRPFPGDVCVCNIPQLDIEYDYISVVDRKATDYIINNGLKFDRPILIPKQLDEEIRNQKKPTKMIATFKEKLMNSAATAAYHFAQEYDVIWLYGCDSLWSTVTKSHQDELIPRAPRPSNLHERWRKHWKTAWDTGKQFVIVCPKGTETVEYGKNVAWNHSKR